MTLRAAELRTLFASAMDWQTYLATDPAHARAWQDVYDAAALDPSQEQLIRGFIRTMHVLCLSGIWCGDCAQQLPLLQRIADAGSTIIVRYLDRDAAPELQRRVRINGGDRVPVALFLAEDDEPVAIYGDRTLSRYRMLAARTLGPACPLPGAPVPEEEWRAALREWLEEVERVHLLLRLSNRLRQVHGD